MPRDYTAPTINRMVKELNLEPIRAMQAREIMKAPKGYTIKYLENHEKQFPVTLKWYHSCYHKPNRSELKMEALNELLNGHGAEAIMDPNADIFDGPLFRYVNFGDTYALTIVLDGYRFIISSWGDLIESPKYRRRFDYDQQ